MGWRFHKSINILPGITLNLGKKGISSVSIGPRGAKLNIGKGGTKVSAGIPGTGLYYTKKLGKAEEGSKMRQCPFCGHRMRKKWDECPKCHHPLPEEG